jgi:uncharacterized lipoprotein YajG
MDLHMKSVTFPLILASLLLSACAGSTPATLQSAAPEAVFTSDKVSSEIARCIVSAWENTPNAVANYRPTAEGYRVALHFGGRLRYMADVETIAIGSKTRVYIGNMTAAFGQHHAVGQAANCQ